MTWALCLPKLQSPVGIRIPTLVNCLVIGTAQPLDYLRDSNVRLLPKRFYCSLDRLRQFRPDSCDFGKVSRWVFNLIFTSFRATFGCCLHTGLYTLFGLSPFDGLSLSANQSQVKLLLCRGEHCAFCQQRYESGLNVAKVDDSSAAYMIVSCRKLCKSKKL